MSAIAVRHIGHCNVNCSSIARSRRFYEEVVGLKAYTHTNPEPQVGGGFPLPAGEGSTVQWDAWIMHDHRGPGASPAVDLLEWKQPGPTGDPYPSANHLGFYRLCYLVPSVDEMYARFQAAGATVFSPPATAWLDAERTQTVQVFCGLDPDGTCLEFVENDDVPATQSVHVNVNCSNLEESLAWYTGNLGFEAHGHSAPGPEPGAAFNFDGDCEWEAYFLSLPGQQRVFTIDLLQWKDPAPVGRPYATANNRGIYRMALMVDDIQASYQTLLANGVSCPTAPVKLDMGPGVPVDGVWALFFPDPDGTCIELIERPATTTAP
jgi:catechol 2,3-dioxygenase-like lactoylglutathione lyase family enzyme